MNRESFLLLLALLFALPLHLQASSPCNNMADTTCISDSAKMFPPAIGVYHVKPMKNTLRHSLPLVAASLLTFNVDDNIRELRFTGAGSFHTKIDNVSQLVPLMAQLSMRGFGYKGRSKSWGKMLVSDALGMALMGGMVNAGKYSFGRLRPDGTAANSYPSGHTATAFACATFFHLEYGSRSPWYSMAGYTLASLTGISRIVNNRHWASDVLCGAAVGILVGELGYWISDLIFRDPTGYNYKLTKKQEGTLESMVISLSTGNRYINRQMDFEGKTVERTDAFGMNLKTTFNPSFARWVRIGSQFSVSTEKQKVLTRERPAKVFVAPAISLGLSAGVEWHPWQRASVWAEILPSILFRTDFTNAQDEPDEMSSKLHRRSSFQPAFQVGVAYRVSDHMGIEAHAGYQLGEAVYHLMEETSTWSIIKKRATVPYRGFEFAVGLQFYPFR
ncbi:phosphoesterase [Porphyromonas gingivalis]|uniref:lipid A C1-phosphatase n=1 Tax=Porphyromonas gingivalis TaxID=837 RepID=UPI000B4DEB07|nr:phosphatase PAP2 family protein [Porphyromonas gingivalis]OWP28296.1 phosphoesterase [Porphyromonas gingivalis]